MNLRHWVQTGTVHPFHPAGLFILLAILLGSFLVAKSFCAWVCPIGFLSETLWNLRVKLVGWELEPPRWLDWPLRALKYTLLGLFSFVIFFAMDIVALKGFLDTPYNLMSDVKMYLFFADMSRITAVTLLLLVLLSLVIRGFWCRYLCPYGALLGLLGLLSPLKVQREASSCINCRRCTKVCPSRIQVHQAKRVLSDECISCGTCVEACPVPDTLAFKAKGSGRSVSRGLIPLLVVALFVVAYLTGQTVGLWHNHVEPAQYRELFSHIHEFTHP
jgi:polyferredoxin